MKNVMRMRWLILQHKEISFLKKALTSFLLNHLLGKGAPWKIKETHIDEVLRI